MNEKWKQFLPPILGAAYAAYLIVRAATAYNNPLNQTDINTAIQLGGLITAGLYGVLYMQPPTKPESTRPTSNPE